MRDERCKWGGIYIKRWPVVEECKDGPCEPMLKPKGSEERRRRKAQNIVV